MSADAHREPAASCLQRASPVRFIGRSIVLQGVGAIAIAMLVSQLAQGGASYAIGCAGLALGFVSLTRWLVDRRGRARRAAATARPRPREDRRAGTVELIGVRSPREHMR